MAREIKRCDHLNIAKKLIIFSIVVDVISIGINTWLNSLGQNQNPLVTFLYKYGFSILSMSGIAFYVAILLVIMHLQKKDK